MVNEGVCVPGSTAGCYSGPAGTEGVGVCHAGTKTCTTQGTGYGLCVGEVTPLAETCATSADDDCDGAVNEEGEGCVCLPDSIASCYSGPAGTAGVGMCRAGTRTCNSQGTGYGSCTGEVLPATEVCGALGQSQADEDCNGQINEGVCADTSVAAGGGHSRAVRSDGSVWAWEPARCRPPRAWATHFVLLSTCLVSSWSTSRRSA